MERPHRRPFAGLLCLIFAGFAGSCAHDRQVWYPRGPRSAARVKPAPKVQARGPSAGPPVRGARKPGTLVTVE